jgi:ribosomal subunit interface protein
MKIEVIGKNGFTPSPANREYAEKKLRKLEDFFGEKTELNALVVCKVYKQMHKVEITIPTKNLVMRAECNEQDLYAAIDRVVDKLLQQVRKHKTRIKSKLAKEGIKCTKVNGIDEAIMVQNLKNIEGNELFKLGYFTIQDISSMLVGKIANPEKDSKVLDICSAPGG